ncbi:sugar kinase [Alteromonas sp. ALT199]|uniref:sugar kinase n=1 Tax=unclassified Alteromonas TaxID=2614992 RepID=UPI00044C14DA|nr:sugar kinase [Alteromonas sp. ALT199]
MSMKAQPHAKRLMAIGECMVELVHSAGDSYQLGFAGDTLNALIYAKRWKPDTECSFFSAIGTDTFSNQMMKFFELHGINTSMVARSKNRNVGLYSIVTDQYGERSFDYWRDQSAAKVMMSLHKAQSNALEAMDMVYFSGIGLSILSDADKEELLALIEAHRAKGALVAFDSNYRASMWNGSQHAQIWFDKAYRISDIALPGLDDHKSVYQHQNVNDVVEYLTKVGCSEYVVKAGTEGMYGYKDKRLVHHRVFNPAPTQVDTTAAGDSFAGVYLISRLTGDTMAQSIQAADMAAREVVQHTGAIVSANAIERVRNEFCAQRLEEVDVYE